MKNLWILAEVENGDNDVVQGDALTGGDDQTDAVDITETALDENGNLIETPKEKQGIPTGQLIMMGAIFVIMYLILFRGPKKKQQQHTQMVKALGKNDRVRTIGGILGTVIDVKDNELTIKIDESNNTKIKVVPGAIAEVIKDKQD